MKLAISRLGMVLFVLQILFAAFWYSRVGIVPNEALLAQLLPGYPWSLVIFYIIEIPILYTAALILTALINAALLYFIGAGAGKLGGMLRPQLPSS